MFPILFIQILHQAATEMVTVQPYGPLMCQQLAQKLTNKTDSDNFDPKHLTCHVDVPEPHAETLGMQMRCVMCTEVPGAPASQQVCQTVNTHTVCSLISNNRACIFTNNIDRNDNGRKMINWTEWRRVGPPCGKQLEDRISAELLHSGDTVVIHLCKSPSENNKPSVERRGVQVYRRDITECKRSTSKMISSKDNHFKQLHQSFLNGEESINCFRKAGTFWLTMASVSYEKHNVFELLMGVGAELSHRNVNNNTVLHCGPIKKYVEYLVEIGLDIDARSSEGFTPFLLAVRSGSVEVLDYLASVGCNIKVVSNGGFNALHFAVYSGKIQVVDRILALDCCDLGAKPKYTKKTAYEIAKQRKLSAIAEKLLMAQGQKKEL